MNTGLLARSLLDFFLPVACLGCGARLPLDRSDDLACVNCVGRLRPVPAPRCPRCDIPLGTARSAHRPCTECADWPYFVTGARCAVVMEAPASTLVHAFKYDGWRQLSTLMGERVAALVRVHGLPDSGSSHPWSPERTGETAPVRREAPVETSVGQKALAEFAPPLVVPVPTTASRERQRGYNQAELLAEVVAERNGLDLVRALKRSGKSRTQVSLHAAERLANVRHAFSMRTREAPRVQGANVLLVDDVLTTGATALAAAYALHSGGADRVTILTFGRALPRRDPGSRESG